MQDTKTNKPSMTMEERVEKIEKNVGKILELMQGNELDKEDMGFIGKVNSHGRRISKLEKFKDRTVWAFIGGGLVGGGGIYALIEKFFFNH